MIAHDLILTLQRYERIYNSMGPPLQTGHLMVLGGINNPFQGNRMLAAAVGMDQLTVGHILHRIKKRKFIEGVRTKLRVTMKGLEAYDRSMSIKVSAENELLDTMSQSMREVFRQMIRTTANASLFQNPSPPS